MTSRPVRLVTFVDLDEGDAGTGTLSFSAVLSAVLDDGRRVVLLDDRGWTQSALRVSGVALDAADRPSPWRFVTAQSIEETARTVVGPDEPFGGYVAAEMAEAHWQYLARALRDEGISIDPADLSSLPHEVELSEELGARIDRQGGD